MFRLSVIIVILTFSKFSLAQDESPDIDFFEWLGEIAEVEELGVDIDQLLIVQEDSGKKSEENSK